LLQENRGILALEVLVEKFFARTIEDTGVERVGMEVDSTVKLVLL